SLHDALPILFFRAYFWTNLLVWLLARPNSIHIGASGIVYALAIFLIFFGVFYRDFRSLIITVVVFLLYGGVFYGILPGDPHRSEEHTSELQSRESIVCRLLLGKKKCGTIGIG